MFFLQTLYFLKRRGMDGLKPARPCLRAVGTPLNGCLCRVANASCRHPLLLSSVAAYRTFILPLSFYPIFSPTKEPPSPFGLACPFGVPYGSLLFTRQYAINTYPAHFGVFAPPYRVLFAERLHASLSLATSNLRNRLFDFPWYLSLITRQ